MYESRAGKGSGTSRCRAETASVNDIAEIAKSMPGIAEAILKIFFIRRTF
jgi:hypothetical protein